MRVELVARFDYGRTVPCVSRLDDGSLRLIAGPNMLVLRTTVPLRGENLAIVGEFVVAAGETARKRYEWENLFKRLFTYCNWTYNSRTAIL